MMSTETALSTGQAQTTIADPTTLPAVSQDGGTFVTPVFTRPKVVTFSHLAQKLEKYISPADMKRILEAFRFADEKHLGQIRKSGDPYISHPLWPKSAPTGSWMHKPSWPPCCMM